MAFVSELNYGAMKPMAVDGKPSIRRYKSDNQSYTAGEVIRIEIPTGGVGDHRFPHDTF